MGKDEKSFYMSETSSSIADTAVAKPPHYEITLALFPNSSLTDFWQLPKKFTTKVSRTLMKSPITTTLITQNIPSKSALLTCIEFI